MANTEHSVIDFDKTQVHLNPALPLPLQETLLSLGNSHAQTQQSRPFVWILSSGTSTVNQSSYKFIGLTHEAFLASAQAVNNHLLVNSSDSWLNILPLFHVGGLSILYRAFHSKTLCNNLWNSNFKWNPYAFHNSIKDLKATITSLVPTQIHDLIEENLQSPPTLRALVVGGAHLSLELYSKARNLGWPVLPSFGMTEAASQIATASLKSLKSHSIAIDSALSSSPTYPYPDLECLGHIFTQVDENQILSIKGPSLFEGYYPIVDEKPFPWVSPIDAKGWFQTQDCAIIDKTHLKILARRDELIKIRGEIINLASLRNKLASLCSTNLIQYECTIASIPDSRIGQKLILVANTPTNNLPPLLALFNFNVMPFERISDCYGPIEIPKNHLGKILHNQLSHLLSQVPVSN